MDSFKFRMGALRERWKTICFAFPLVLLLAWFTVIAVAEWQGRPQPVAETYMPPIFRVIAQAEDGTYRLVALAYRSPGVMETPEEDRQATERRLGHEVLWEPNHGYNFGIAQEDVGRAEPEALTHYREPGFQQRALRFKRLPGHGADGEGEYVLWVRPGRFEYTYVYRAEQTDATLLKYAEFTPKELLQALAYGTLVLMGGIALVWFVPKLRRPVRDM